MFRDCVIDSVYKLRDEMYVRGVERSVRLFVLKEEYNWIDEEFGIVVKYVCVCFIYRGIVC